MVVWSMQDNGTLCPPHSTRGCSSSPKPIPSVYLSAYFRPTHLPAFPMRVKRTGDHSIPVTKSGMYRSLFSLSQVVSGLEVTSPECVFSAMFILP